MWAHAVVLMASLILRINGLYRGNKMKTVSSVLALLSVAVISLSGCMSQKESQSSGAGHTSAAATGDGYGARAGQGVDNSVLTSRVKTALAAHSSLKTLVLNVDSDNGAVTISGTVSSREAYDSVDRVARDVDGVRSVNNRLLIRPEN